MVSLATLAGHGREPLTVAWTSTRTVVTVTQALALAAAISASPRIMGQSAIEGPSAFQIEVAKHIDSVAHFEKDRFYLTSNEPKTEIAFDLYDEAVRCERAAAFNLVFLKNDQGSIAVGICDKEEPRVRDLAQEAQRKLAEKLGTLARSSPQPEKLKSMGWEWTRKSASGGWEAFSFPVIGISHGVLWANTLVLSNAATHRAVIVQADLAQLCDPSSNVRKQIRTPLCEDTVKALTDIALALAHLS